MLDVVFANPWVRALGLLLVLFFVALLCWFMTSVLVPLLLAFFVAYVFDPVVDRLERRHVPRLAAALGLMFAILLLGLCVPLIMQQMIQEGQSLVRLSAPQKNITDDVLDKLPIERWLALWDASRSEELGVDEAAALIASEPDEPFDARTELARRIGEWVNANAVNLLRTHSEALAGFGKLAGTSAVGLFATVGNWILGLILLVGNFVLFAFVTIYLLKDYDDIVAAALDLLPVRYRAKTAEIFGKIDQQLKAFLRGQFMVCCCLAAMYAIGLSIAGVPLALPLALFGGLASFVPYLGLALTIGPAVLLTLIKYGADWHVVVALSTFIIAQAIEGNLLTPKIVGSQVGLGPVWVILAIMVFGGTMGFLGLLLAVPIAAALKVLVVEGLEVYRGSAFFRGTASPPSAPD